MLIQDLSRTDINVNASAHHRLVLIKCQDTCQQTETSCKITLLDTPTYIQKRHSISD